MKILIIEDDKDIREFLKMGLETECFVVDLAEDGEKGSFLARSNPYDLIILDNVLPKKIGTEVCREIREDGISCPILILSQITETDTKIEQLNIGADDYLCKPFSLEELLARMRALLRRPQAYEKEEMVLDNLVVNFPRHSVKRAEKEIYLTRKEFMLLEYLLKNAGVVLSRGKIIEHVWDMNADPFSNTVESHIVNLRRKIDTFDQKKLIHTIPGRGYKIDLLN